MHRIDLCGSDWKLKEFVGLDWVWRDSVMPNTEDSRWWLPATVPGSVMADLVAAGQVPNPYHGLNSKLVEWVPARTWVCRKTFMIDELAGDRAVLCFEGADYSAEVFLNGTSLGRCEGMFLRFEFEVAGLLRPGENLLAVALDAAPPEQPQVGRTSLVHTHKSRMTYWWDFCPRMVHVGLWDAVYLDMTGPARLEDVYVHSALEGNGAAVVTVEAEADAPDGWRLSAALDGQTAETTFGGGRAVLRFRLERPELWWPNGYGGQHLYEVAVRLLSPGGEASDNRALRHGIRSLEWRENPGAPAEMPPYTLWVNGRRAYLRGVNWVPMDVLYGPRRPEKLRRLIALAKAAGVVMLRVWGGGLIEKDDFYEACAEAGILVWQEFIQSSSGIDNRTPEAPEFTRMMLAQGRAVIRRKRSHTALAVWCGGNELQYGDGTPMDEADPLLAGLGGLVRGLDPQRRWLPTSPYGGLFLNALENIENHPNRLADVHGPWEHQGFEGHCRLYNAGTSLLSTEFGVEGFAHARVLRATLDEANLWPPTKDNPAYFHRGAWWNNAPLVQEMFGGTEDLDRFVRASQYLQFEGLRYALECHLRRAPRHSGSFPWQFNEPYPNASCTSLLDYYTAPKPGYYGMQSAYRPVYLSAAFAAPRIMDGVLAFGLHLTGAEAENAAGRVADCAWGLYGPDGTKLAGQAVALPDGDNNLCLGTYKIEGVQPGVVLLRLRCTVDGRELVNDYAFTTAESYRPLLAAPATAVELRHDGKAVNICNTGAAVAWWVLLEAEAAGRPAGLFAENYLCLLPGETRRVGLEPPDAMAAKITANGFNCADELDLLKT